MTNDPALPLTAPRVLLLPGWLDSDAAHWQSRWEAVHGDTRVQQDDWQWPKRGDWMSQLEEAVLADPRPAVLAAHSLGCLLVAAWAAHSRNASRVVGALLVAPPDIERVDTPPQLATWRPIVRERLPFRSIAVVSSDDPYCAADRAAALATAWGSALVPVGARGHINGESGLENWPEGREMLNALVT
jgi:predicted alpha/beta hydrolase family esterase